MSSAEAAQHLLNRRRARTDVVTYAGIIDVPGRPLGDARKAVSKEAEEDEDNDEDYALFAPVESRLATHHKLILAAMARTAAKRYGRLMIFAPPGSAKTSYASVVFPSHYLGSIPGSRLLLASYGDSPAKRMGRRTRAVLQQPRYHRIFNTGLNRRSMAADNFILENGSEYLASSISGAVTSYRADGVIIDDPVKGRAEAKSEKDQGKTWEAYTDDISSRLVPGGWLTLIQTRWDERDLAGQILPEGWKGESGIFRCRDGRDWEILCLQAKCQTTSDPLGRQIGEYIWPEWFDSQHWVQYECLPQTWASLFQQMPSPLEGALFKPDMLSTLDAVPTDVTKWVRAYDLAATADDGAWTAGVLMGMREGKKPVVADVRRLQGSPEQVENLIVKTAEADGKDVEVHLPQDPGQAGKSQIAYLTSKLVGYKVKSSPETGDKVTRASPYASQVNVGNGSIVRGTWNRAFTEELRVFPNGRFKDQVDAASRAFAAIVVTRRSFFG